MDATVSRVELVENGETHEVHLDVAAGVTLATSGLVDAAPSPSGRTWLLRPTTKVGALRVGDVEVHVAPKIPISRLIFLLGYATAGLRWDHAEVDVEQAPDLMHAVAEVFARMTGTALKQGLLLGYRTLEEASPVVRGRIREDEQMRRRYGLMVPVEVRFDDFTADTPENRLLRAAVLRCLRLPGLDRRLRHRLLRIDLSLADVTPIRSAALLETWRPTRLNARLHSALRLAEVIVRATSFEPGDTGLAVNGFVIDMARVFEDFVCTALGSELKALGGVCRTQDRRWTLDVAGQVAIRPDLVWYADDGRTPLAVVDAKYKAEKPSGFPDADLYQLLAYCTVLGLREGHLVYAKGNEHGRVHTVVNSGAVINAHTVDLTLQPTELLAQVSELARLIACATPFMNTSVAGRTA